MQASKKKKKQQQIVPTAIFVVCMCLCSFFQVSYPNQKVRLQWDDTGVVLNPELKLLQYNLGQPLEVSESIGYMPEKHGKKCSESVRENFRFFFLSLS